MQQKKNYKGYKSILALDRRWNEQNLANKMIYRTKKKQFCPFSKSNPPLEERGDLGQRRNKMIKIVYLWKKKTVSNFEMKLGLETNSSSGRSKHIRLSPSSSSYFFIHFFTDLIFLASSHSQISFFFIFKAADSLVSRRARNKEARNNENLLNLIRHSKDIWNNNNNKELKKFLTWLLSGGIKGSPFVK